MDTNNEILDAIEILADKKIGENITKVLTGVCTAVNIYKDTCTMNCNGVSSTVYFYGSPPEINGLYRIFVPSNDMSRAFVIVPPRFTVNPNLFDNWDYSVNQQYPRNSSIGFSTDTAYRADRWIKSGSTTSGSIKSGELHLTNAGGDGWGWQQRFEAADLKYGITYTLSALVKPTNANTAIALSYGWNLQNVHRSRTFSGLPVNSWTLITWTFTLVQSTTYYNFRVRSNNTLPSDWYIGPMKLEVGPYQTLAHKENGSWILNESSIYSEQLRRCQEYFIRLGYSDRYCELGMGQSRTTGDVVFNVPLPTAMRSQPNVGVTGHITFRNASNYYTNSYIQADAISPGSALLVSTPTMPSAGLVVDAFLEPGNYITLNANL